MFAAAITLFVFASISLFMVSERAIAALWQWYKFYGYETAGVITLSKQAGVLFAVFAVTIALMCLKLKKIGELSDARVARLSKWSLTIVCASIALYCGLASSPLNSWRP